MKLTQLRDTINTLPVPHKLIATTSILMLFLSLLLGSEMKGLSDFNSSRIIHLKGNDNLILTTQLLEELNKDPSLIPLFIFSKLKTKPLVDISKDFVRLYFDGSVSGSIVMDKIGISFYNEFNKKMSIDELNRLVARLSKVSDQISTSGIRLTYIHIKYDSNKKAIEPSLGKEVDLPKIQEINFLYALISNGKTLNAFSLASSLQIDLDVRAVSEDQDDSSVSGEYTYVLTQSSNESAESKYNKIVITRHIAKDNNGSKVEYFTISDNFSHLNISSHQVQKYFANGSERFITSSSPLYPLVKLLCSTISPDITIES